MADTAKCIECGGRVDGGRCLRCFTDTGCCADCGGQVNYRGRCLDYTCGRFGLRPDQEELRHTGADRGGHHRPWQPGGDDFTDPADALRWLADHPPVHRGAQ